MNPHIQLHVVPHAPREGGGYQVCFDGGEAILQRGLTADELELVWLSVDSPRARGRGLGEAVMAALSRLFANKKIRPWSVSPDARGFWLKMADKGYCLAP